MNPTILLERLLAAARREPPADRVPYAFERRIMAKLAQRTPQDAWAAWGAILWRAVVPCCAIMLIVGLFGALATAGPSISPTAGDDSLEAVLLANLDNSADLP